MSINDKRQSRATPYDLHQSGEDHTSINLNEVIRTGNPYHGPIKTIASQLIGLEWRLPFITQALVFIVSCIVLVFLVILYMTVGLISQITSIFSHLIQQARQDMRGRGAIEKTGFIVAIGIYFTIWAPLWIIQLPLFIIGWSWEYLGYLTIIPLVIAAILIWFYISPSAEIPFMVDLSRWIHAFLESTLSHAFSHTDFKEAIPIHMNPQ